jgi:Asp-tRNA(Asn)/Glu-tRNA(Gln) amidotransferase A subunit family amidase
VYRLRKAGAVILGKTNLSEWANFRSRQSTSGWSSRGGQTRDPYALDRNPCGSSSGSAVAVAANLCALTVGTETVAGYPNITVPAGYVRGLPVGVSFFAGPFQEPTHIKLAFAFERATQVRQPPQFAASADLAA